MFKLQYDKSFKDESLNISDPSSNGKGKGVSETVRPRKARRWSDAQVARSLTTLGANQYGAGLFSKDSGLILVPDP